MVGVFQLLWRRGGDVQELCHYPLFDVYGWPWICHGACGCVIAVCYNEHILRLKV